ncbi:MAG: hypothetical protein LH480_01120 [Rubrivivax sp.]|nr:hypothetical protein [Rubrivivax sp.]
MLAHALAQELNTLCAAPGVKGCAVIDTDNGMVLHAAGARGAEAQWEAAVEYWRLHGRIRNHFEELGELGAVVMHHRLGKLVLLPLGTGSALVLACIADERGVDWQHWQHAVRQIAQRLAGKL